MTQILLELLSLLGVWFTLASFAYCLPYLIRRGWIEGENATTRKKFVCEACFRDTKKLKKFMDENNIPSV